MKLIIASNNAGKIKEFKAMLSPLGYEPISMKEAGIDIDIAEDGDFRAILQALAHGLLRRRAHAHDAGHVGRARAALLLLRAAASATRFRATGKESSSA